jgi:hypothetical protein
MDAAIGPDTKAVVVYESFSVATIALIIDDLKIHFASLARLKCKLVTRFAGSPIGGLSEQRSVSV